MRGNGEIVLYYVLCKRRFFAAKEPPLALSQESRMGRQLKERFLRISFYSSRIICA